MKKLLCILMALLMTVTLLTGCSTLQDEISKILGNSDTAKNPVTRGTWEGDLYLNSYMDLAFKEPDGWKHSTDEQIVDLFELDSSLLDDDGTFDYNLEQDQNIYDMVCMDPLTGDSISIFYENLYVSMTMDEYLDVLMEQAAPSEFSDEVTIVDEGTVKIGQSVYNFFEIEYISDGASQTYAIRAVGDHMTAILFTDIIMDDNSKEMMMDAFSLLEDEE